MKYKNTILALLLMLSLTGCGSFRNNLNKKLNSWGSGHYIVTVWSGAKAVRVYDVHGYVNTEENSDGWFFTVNGNLIRISGTVTIEQQ